MASAPAAAADLTEAARLGRWAVQPGSGDGILSRPGSLIHHWRGETFLAGVTLDQAISVSQAYSDYSRIQWVRVDERRAYVVSVAEEVREVANAGKANERCCPRGATAGTCGARPR